ncbi:MAG: hypothetical protein V4592_08100 [Bacteroidota bacterium]
MPHIFRFHNGTNNNIYDWTASDRITPGMIRNVLDKTNVLSSAAGTSIPTPIARLFLFRTAFEIVAGQVREQTAVANSIYAGLVSETLDLLELLYQCGADSSRFRYERWVFENTDEGLRRFQGRPGHRLFAQGLKQAAAQAPFNGRIDLTLIFFRDGANEVLLGGTSPFTFVFTSPNFKRKMKLLKFGRVSGLVSGDVLFDNSYLPLEQREDAFIRYIEGLASTPGISASFSGFSEYAANCKTRFPLRFTAQPPALQDIRVGDTALQVGQIPLRQISQADHRQRIADHSDFKLRLPADTHFSGALTPLFLVSKMTLDGQYTSPSNNWQPGTLISEAAYHADSLAEIMEGRDLPGLSAVRYPFLSAFDFFERALVRFKSPGYQLNDQRFVTVIDHQTFAIPLKPLFFHFFPIHRLKEYLTVELVEGRLSFTLRIPVFGPTKQLRTVVCHKVYSDIETVNYSGIMGIFPFTRTDDASLAFTNQYTVASYEKTNADAPLKSLTFYREDGLEKIKGIPAQRTNDTDINTSSTYYQLNHAFDMIQLTFIKDNSSASALIIPKFQVVRNGDATYVYAIDFGTSNTHIEYGLVSDGKLTQSQPFEIGEEQMQMYLLHQPARASRFEGEQFLDYEKSLGGVIDKAWQLTMREFLPFQIGPYAATPVRFPFRTATCESTAFISNPANDRLFVDANIGFYMDYDPAVTNVRYKTDLKWLLQQAGNDPLHINRVKLFARQLLLMIRTKALLSPQPADLQRLKIVLSFPISMGETLKQRLIGLFDDQRKEVFGADARPLASPVTESIAPYYQLKSQNIKIQNDNFCNIDIGGGTTDIVLTRTEGNGPVNELQCYCASFRFAGRQLWSSGGNEYHSDDNGIVAYYKKFIYQVDPAVYNRIRHQLESKTVKTEDIVGYLFSDPKFRFKDVFSEHPAFRVVPLVHYAAIIFYISRLAVWQGIALPRTLSFSGKGSEYIRLIFPDAQDLRGFTFRLLSIFSGAQPRPDFMIENVPEPKVITAKGALYYAVEDVTDAPSDDWGSGTTTGIVSREKKLIKNNVVYKGFAEPALEEKALNYGELSTNAALYRSLMDNVQHFFEQLFGQPELVQAINKKLEINNFGEYKQFFLPDGTDIYTSGVLRDSFKAAVLQQNPADQISDPPFFFALDYALINLSKAIAEQATL